MKHAFVENRPTLVYNAFKGYYSGRRIKLKLDKQCTLKSMNSLMTPSERRTLLKPVGMDFSQAVAGYKCCTQASLARRSNIMNDR